MSPYTIHWVEDLSHNDTLAITKLLRLPERSQIDENWLVEQEKKIEYLPAHLKRSKALFPRFVERFIKSKAIFCPSHRCLDSQLIRRLFLTIVDECTTRVRRFTDSPPSDTDIRQWWIRVKSINSLWTQPILYRYLFNANPGDPEFEYTHSECEACILATIGGNTTMLADLRISAITRRTNHGPNPRIIRVLDGWLYWTGIAETIKAECDPLYFKVRNARRGRPITQSYSSNTIPVTVNDRTERQIPESTDADIIDFYLNRLSRMSRTHQNSGRPNNDSTHSLHPAFRENIVFDASTGIYGQRPEEDIPPVPRIPSIIPEPKRQPPAASSSRYSRVDSGIGYSDSIPKKTEWRTNDYIEQRSEAYRKLVGDPEGSSIDSMEAHSPTNMENRLPETVKSTKTARRWSGSSSARGRDRMACHRAKAYRKLEGKTEGSQFGGIGEGRRMSANVSSTCSSPKLSWEQFKATVRLNSQSRYNGN
ncbi:hypothetical protein V491_01201 [Pseudogymnoascus sp. VKM F-3775]|nr:hypothetical protein V491_01201 [Pseudogymnoascus sp. VKM F-3775]